MKIQSFLVLILLVSASMAQAATRYNYKSKHYTVQLFDETDRQVVVFNGFIMPFDTDKGLRDVVKQLIPGKNTTLAIGVSQGGETRVFNNFGRALQRTCPAETCHLVTYVKSYCVSSCTFLYLYGRERIASPGARFGFHREYISAIGISVVVQSKSKLAKILLNAGVDASWVYGNIEALTANQKNCVYASSDQLVKPWFVHRIESNFPVSEGSLALYTEYPDLPKGGTAFVPAI